MYIADSVLKSNLEHVYWINGGPCGGKTTTIRKLAATYGFQVFDSGKHIQRYQQAASFHDHPALLRPFIDWEWFFNRPVNVYARWLADFNHEVTEWAIADLLKLSTDVPILVEQDFADAELLRRIAPRHRILYLFAEDNLIAKDLLNRDDHEPIRRIIHEHTKDPVASERNVVAVATEISHRIQAEAIQVGHFVHVRTSRDTDGDLFPLAERHFRLK